MQFYSLLFHFYYDLINLITCGFIFPRNLFNLIACSLFNGFARILFNFIAGVLFKISISITQYSY